MHRSREESERTAKIIVGGVLVAIGLFGIVIGALLIDKSMRERCTVPSWIELDFVDGGKTLVHTYTVKAVVPVTHDDKPASHVLMGDGASVIVTNSVEKLSKKLCLGE